MTQSSPNDPLQLLILGEDDKLTRDLWAEINRAHPNDFVLYGGDERSTAPIVAVYVPSRRRGQATVSLESANQALEQIVDARPECAVVISSAEVYGASHRSVGLAAEDDIITSEKRNPVGRGWLALEDRAARVLSEAGIPSTVFRAASLIAPEKRRTFGRFTVCHAGYDPPMQLLSWSELCRAVVWAMRRRTNEIFNLAPNDGVAVRAALKLAGSRPIPIPSLLQDLARAVLAPLGLAECTARAEYLRYPFTISSQRLRAAGYEVTDTTVAALRAAGRRSLPTPADDPFGLDAKYLEFHARGQIGFLRKLYWRVEARGQGNVPEAGPAIMVGVHRGFMPWDGVITADAVYRHCSRVPRFLIHPCLVKFPFLSNFMRKLGGVMAGRRNAWWLLSRGDLVGVYPEGIRGAFTYYKDAYRIGKAWRDDYAQFALEFGAPIIPFVTVGSAEIYPILAKVHWTWWKRWTEWPCLPITATFPFVPFPLPSKWHLRFLPPIWPHDVVTKGIDSEEARRQLDTHVREVIQSAMLDLRSRRPSAFWGDVAESEPAD